MRGVVCALVFVAVVGCSAPAVDPQPDSIATAPAPTTIPPTPQSTMEDADAECTESGGLLTTRRGFVCPPHLEVGPGLDKAGSTGGPPTPRRHLAGEYTTRVFRPAITFTRPQAFGAWGELPEEVSLDISPGRGLMYGLASSIVPQLRELVDQEWATAVEVAEIEVDGHAGTRTDFIVGPQCDGSSAARLCYFDAGTMPEYRYQAGVAITVVIVEVPDGPMGILVKASPPDVDSYWSEVAGPVIDSLRFPQG